MTAVETVHEEIVKSVAKVESGEAKSKLAEQATALIDFLSAFILKKTVFERAGSVDATEPFKAVHVAA